MSAADVLAGLSDAGVVLYLTDGGELRARSKPGALTEAIRATIDAHRPELLATLADPIVIPLANASARTPVERDDWQREIDAALRWLEAGNEPDGRLCHDVAGLRQLVPPGVC